MTGLPSEDDLIARHFAPLAGPAGLGLRDDAALVPIPEGHDLVATKDALVAGVHFFANDPPERIARKALRVNLSDLAAKGAAPLGYLLALALPAGTTDEDLAGFAAGLRADGEAFGLPLLGGDTVRTPGPLMLSVTALGTVPRGRMVRRTGVRAGDEIWVTGTIGDAALGLQLRLAPDRPGFRALDEVGRAHLLDRYLLPRPRNALAPALLDLASGGMDVSDGLVGDLRKMLRVSGVTAEIDVDAVPLSPAARAAIAAEPALLETALGGGDDYELLVALPPESAAAFVARATAGGVNVTRLGAARAGTDAARFLRGDDPDFSIVRGSFSHF